MRGATDLVDGLRWVMVVQHLDEKQAQDLGIAAERRELYRQYSIPKVNYEATKSGLYVKWVKGVFVQEHLQSKRARTAVEKAAAAKPILCKVILRLEERGYPVTVRALREHCKAKPEPSEANDLIPIGKNDEAVRQLLSEAKQDELVKPYTTKLANNKQGNAWKLTSKGKQVARDAPRGRSN